MVNPIFQLFFSWQNGCHFTDSISDAFSWMKSLKFWLKLHQRLFPLVQLTITHITEAHMWRDEVTWLGEGEIIVNDYIYCYIYKYWMNKTTVNSTNSFQANSMNILPLNSLNVANLCHVKIDSCFRWIMVNLEFFACVMSLYISKLLVWYAHILCCYGFGLLTYFILLFSFLLSSFSTLIFSKSLKFELLLFWFCFLSPLTNPKCYSNQ